MDPAGVTTDRCNTNGEDNDQASVAICKGEYKGGLREPCTTVTPLSYDGGNYDDNDMRSLVELGRDYNGLVDAIEEELCAVEGLEGIQAQARKGRSTGTHFCWKPAMGDDTVGAAKTTSVSRAWRRTAKWLGDVLHTKMEKHAEAARWKVRFYRPP